MEPQYTPYAQNESMKVQPENAPIDPNAGDWTSQVSQGVQFQNNGQAPAPTGGGARQIGPAQMNPQQQQQPQAQPGSAMQMLAKNMQPMVSPQAMQSQPGVTTQGQPGAGGAPSGPGAAIQPTYLNQMFPNGIPQAKTELSQTSTGADDFLSRIQGALQPQFQQQDMAERDALASAGIVGGTTGGDMANLFGQQQKTLQNDSEQALMQLKQAELGQSEFNANQKNANSQFNIGNQLASGQFDINNNLQAQEQTASMNNQDWLQQLQDQTQLNLAGEQGQNGAYNPVYYQPQSIDPVPYASLGNIANYQPKPTITGSPSNGANTA